MLSFLYEFIPVLLFFLVFKFYGIYPATWVGIIATGIQVLFTWAIKRKFDNKQLITFVVFLLFGSLTLYFHNPIFVKWKPTIVFWIFAFVLLLSHFVGKKLFIQRMIDPVLEGKVLPRRFWVKLNLAWVIFFLLLGAINLIMAYYFSTNAWVNFKFYGILSSLLIFSFLQAIWLASYIK